MTPPAARSRRAPKPDDRRRDAERTRAALLAAAATEFAAHGYAGARTEAIASRAGVNRQLISYYFGGRRGLHDAIQEQWRAQAGRLASPEPSLEEVVRRFARDVIEHPEMHRMAIRSGLDTPAGVPGETSSAVDARLANLRRRQRAGEVSSDIDVGLLLVAMQGAVTAPLVFPDSVRRLTGLDPESPDLRLDTLSTCRASRVDLPGWATSRRIIRAVDTVI